MLGLAVAGADLRGRPQPEEAPAGCVQLLQERPGTPSALAGDQSLPKHGACVSTPQMDWQVGGIIHEQPSNFWAVGCFDFMCVV